MKTKFLLAILLITGVAGFSQANTDHKKQKHMKLNAGIITTKLKESKDFYIILLDLV
jgi:hypothetical protein